MRLHYHRQTWLATKAARRWQRLHFYWPNGMAWSGFGVTVWAREFSIMWRQP